MAKQIKPDIKLESDKKVNYILFFSGFSILAFTALFSLILPHPENISKIIIQTFLATGTALLTSQVPGMMRIKLANGISAAGGFAFGVMVFLIDPSSVAKDKTVAIDQSFLPDCNSTKLKLIVVVGGNTDYTRAIKTYFLNTLQPLLNYKLNKCLYYEDYYISSSVNDTATDAKSSITRVTNRLDTEPYDYYISIGTSASIFLKTYLKNKNFTRKKMIFLGVTDPIGSNLVTTLTERDEITNISGVAYAGNFEKLPIMINKYFPKKKLVYIYNMHMTQDQQIGESLSHNPLTVDDKTLTVRALDRDPVLQDFQDTSKVYFSWITLENFFSTEQVKILKNIPYIVSTTKTHAELGLVPVAISTSDEEIGKAGAAMIIKSLGASSVYLGKEDIVIPKWQAYVNCRLSVHKGIDADAIPNAQKFDCQ